MRQIYRIMLLMVFVSGCLCLRTGDVLAAEKLAPSLVQIEKRLQEETQTSPSEPNSLAFQRAVGEQPARTVEPREMKAKRVLTLEECLQLAFANSNQIKQAREQILAVGGTKLIDNSRFLPSIELISQYEHFRNLQSDDRTDDAHDFSALITQRIFEYWTSTCVPSSVMRCSIMRIPSPSYFRRCEGPSSLLSSKSSKL